MIGVSPVTSRIGEILGLLALSCKSGSTIRFFFGSVKTIFFLVVLHGICYHMHKRRTQTRKNTKTNTVFFFFSKRVCLFVSNNQERSKIATTALWHSDRHQYRLLGIDCALIVVAHDSHSCPDCAISL